MGGDSHTDAVTNLIVYTSVVLTITYVENYRIITRRIRFRIVKSIFGIAVILNDDVIILKIKQYTDFLDRISYADTILVERIAI